MTDMDFVSLVKRMRRLQVEYRKSHSWKVLEELKQVEKLVDFNVQRLEVEEMKRAEAEQPQLF